MSPGTAIQSALATQDTVYRCEQLLLAAIDPVQAAAALRGASRIMLARSIDRARRRVVLAVGELAVVSAGLRGEQPGGDGPSPLAEADALLTTIGFADALLPDERRWFGVIGFDAVRDIERLAPRRDRDLPVYDFFLPEVIVCFEGDAIRVVGRGMSPEAATRACSQAAGMLLRSDLALPTYPKTGAGRFSSCRAAYYDAVRTAKRYITDGDIFQVVLSLAVTADSDADGLAVYDELGRFNPSPYQFWYRSDLFEIAGCSPEPCVMLHHGTALIRPLAGTRPRHSQPDADLRAEQELRGSEKELAEHRMLVDLARNDLGRVCRPGTVIVPRLMEVERYSHVMHLTSDVVGRLRAGGCAADLIRATFPAGTMTGAPKVRAIEIIDELEPVGRSLYSGAVGSFGPDAVELFLTIRSAVLTHGQVRLQAGGGIVHDSEPEHEHAECLAKLAAAARAVDLDLERVR